MCGMGWGGIVEKVFWRVIDKEVLSRFLVFGYREVGKSRLIFLGF